MWPFNRLAKEDAKWRIAVLGASVSAQSLHHRTRSPTGYCEMLRRLQLTRMGVDELIQTTYAGNRVSDGGLARVGDVVALKPNLCIFEPLVEDPTRGSDASRTEILHIYRTLADAGILPVALFLPDPVHRSPKVWPTYPMHREICDKAGIPVIEITLPEAMALEGSFVGIHTLMPGAKLYARRIANAIVDIRRRNPSVRAIARSLKSREPGLFVRKIDLQDLQAVRAFSLSVESKRPLSLRIILHQTIGPHSPVLEIDQSGAPPALSSLWDPYCHHERPSYAPVFNGEVQAGHTTLTISCGAEHPRYEFSRRKQDVWPDAGDRHLRPLGPLILVSDKPLTSKLISVTRYTSRLDPTANPCSRGGDM